MCRMGPKRKKRIFQIFLFIWVETKRNGKNYNKTTSELLYPRSIRDTTIKMMIIAAAVKKKNFFISLLIFFLNLEKSLFYCLNFFFSISILLSIIFLLKFFFLLHPSVAYCIHPRSAAFKPGRRCIQIGTGCCSFINNRWLLIMNNDDYRWAL